MLTLRKIGDHTGLVCSCVTSPTGFKNPAHILNYSSHVMRPKEGRPWQYEAVRERRMRCKDCGDNEAVELLNEALQVLIAEYKDDRETNKTKQEGL